MADVISRLDFLVLVAFSVRLRPLLSGSGKAVGACRPVAGLRLFPVVRFNEFQEGFFISLVRIANAAPEPAWVKLTRVC